MDRNGIKMGLIIYVNYNFGQTVLYGWMLRLL